MGGEDTVGVGECNHACAYKSTKKCMSGYVMLRLKLVLDDQLCEQYSMIEHYYNVIDMTSLCAMKIVIVINTNLTILIMNNG
jgi:hypothetical protein